MDDVKSPKSKIQIIKETFHLYFLLFKKLFPASFLLAFLLTSVRYDFLSSGAGQGQGLLLFILVSIVMGFLGFLFTGILLVMIDSKDPGVGFKYAFNRCAGVSEKILLATILVALLITLGAFLLVIPAIYLGFVLLFVLPILVLENKSAVDAVKLSFKLTKGRWWYITLSYLLAVLIPFIPIMAIKIFMQWFFLSSFSSAVVFLVIKTLLFPYNTILIYIIYKELKGLSTETVLLKQD